MRTLIVDDEPVARQILRELLEEIPSMEIVGEAASGDDAIRQVTRHSPDLMLLDIEMPGLQGFGVLQALRGNGPAVIFVTAYEQHALRAFDAGAVDYLLKPVRKERLAAAIEKVRRQMHTAPDKPTVEPVKPQALAPRRVAVKSGSDFVMLDPSEIYAFQADGEVVHAITATRKYTATHTLRDIEEKLAAAGFRRIHRKTIINTNHIQRISPLSSKRWLLIMSNGLEAIVSKRMAGAIREETRW